MGQYAFSGCSSLESVDLSACLNLESIWDSAFSGCSSLVSVKLPGSLADIVGNAFEPRVVFTVTVGGALSAGMEGKSLLKTEGDVVTLVAYPSAGGNVTLPDTITVIGPSVFSNCTGLTEITMPKVTTIGANAFFQCRALTEITLPEAIAIGDYAFYQCSALIEITLPKANTIGNSAFYNCTTLKTITLPKVTDIGDSAFLSCRTLTKIDLPEGILTIGSSAFSNCLTLASVTIRAESPPTVTANSFQSAVAELKFYVPEGSVAAYKKASVWGITYADKIEAIPEPEA
jgi:hypothetical protein